MAIYRNISLIFWQDTKVVDDMTPEDRYFYLYLLTNPHTNICGCYEVSKRQISNETGYSLETVDNLIKRHGNILKTICYDETTKEVLILKWHKHNWTKSEKLLTGVKTVSEYIKNVDFKRFIEDLIDGKDVENIGYPYPMDTSVSVSVSDTVSVSVLNKSKEIKISKLNMSKFFESVWKLYPRKKGKGGVSDTQKQKLYKIGYDKLKLAIERYTVEQQKNGTESKFYQYGSTFFNTGYIDYLDENYEEAKPKSNNIFLDILEEENEQK